MIGPAFRSGFRVREAWHRYEVARNVVAVNEAVLLKKEPKPALDEAAGKADDLLQENREKYQG